MGREEDVAETGKFVLICIDRFRELVYNALVFIRTYVLVLSKNEERMVTMWISVTFNAPDQCL